MLAADLDHLHSLAQSRDLIGLEQTITQRSPEHVASVLSVLPGAESAIVFRLLAKDTALAVFERLDTAAQADLVAELGQAESADAFASLDPDEQARLLDELPAKVTRRLITTIDPQRRDSVMSILGYPVGSVGRQMAPPFLHALTSDTVGEVLDQIRHSDLGIDDLAGLPVLTDERVLVAIIDPVTLQRHPLETPISAIMTTPVACARTEDNAEDVARRVLDSGILMMPVVDREGRLVGMLSISDAARIDKFAVAEDHARAGASEPLRRPYLLTPVRRVARARVVWLLVLAISAVLTVQVLEMFEATLSQQVTLALFIPLVTGIGGNTGSQAATTVTRALAMGEIRLRDLARVAFKEARTGLLLGLILAVLAFSVGSIFYGTSIGAVIAVTVALNCPIAATVGGVIPLVARWCKVDPAVFSTPFISTFCDASGLLVYFAVAITILGL